MAPPPVSVASFHPGDVGRLLPTETHLLLLLMVLVVVVLLKVLLLLLVLSSAVHEVGHGQARQDHHRLVPDHEGGRHWQQVGDVEGVQVLGVHGVIEGQRVVVVVQQHAQPPQLQAGLHLQLLAVVPHRKVVVAARQHPGGRVLSTPLVLGRRLVGHADGVPAGGWRGTMGGGGGHLTD